MYVSILLIMFRFARAWLCQVYYIFFLSAIVV